MHSVLFVLEKPKGTDSRQTSAWQNAKGQVRHLCKSHAGATLHTEGCVELSLLSAQSASAQQASADGLALLADLVHLAASEELPYRVLFFQEPPQWVTG